MEIELEQAPSTFNPELLNMGDKALIILDIEKFCNVIDNSIETLGMEYSRRKVTYYTNCISK